MNDVTIAIKTFERPDSLKALLVSILHFFPDLPVIIADDSKTPYAQDISRHLSYVECVALPFDVGLSAGRNALLSRIHTKYFVLCDDDILFCEHTRLETFRRILDESDIELIGGVLIDKSATGRFDKPSTYAGHLTLDASRHLRMEFVKPDREVIRCDIVHNFFMANTQAVVTKTGGWDPRFKVLEHTDFFWTAKTSGLKVAFTPNVSVNHTNARPARYIYYRQTRKNRYFRMLFEKLEIASWTGGGGTITPYDVRPRWFEVAFRQEHVPWFVVTVWRRLREMF